MVGNRHRFNAADVRLYEEAEEPRREEILGGLAPRRDNSPKDF